MIKFLINNTYKILAIAATIGGAVSFIQLFTTQDEFALTLTKQSESSLISKSESASDVVILYNNQKVNAIFSSKFTLENTGKKALTKEFIFSPITLASTPGTTIIQAKSKQPEISVTGQRITIRWDLLNPSEKFSFEVISSAPFSPSISGRIKEIQSVQYRDEITDPPPKRRIASLSILWLIIGIISAILMLDSVRLIMHDDKLQMLLSLSALGCAKTRHDFVTHATTLYTDYFNSAPALFVSPKEFANQLKSAISGTGKMTPDALKIADQTIVKYARHANLYTMRAYAIIYAPLILGFCLVRVGIALI